ncbi:hypothetical protein O4G98_15015 [Zoogloeaceae bacterium G21618-S1]|nr:hypothetical protein [Zoogloeaceae bacterium G21618-S1]
MLVVAYLAHAIASVVHTATMPDPKSQAVWLLMPLILTPDWLFDWLPPIAAAASGEHFLFQTVIRYPVGIAFSITVLYALGGILERIWLATFWSGVLVSVLLGLAFGLLWFWVTGANASGWMVSGVLAGGLACLLHPRRPSRVTV